MNAVQIKLKSNQNLFYRTLFFLRKRNYTRNIPSNWEEVEKAAFHSLLWLSLQENHDVVHFKILGLLLNVPKSILYNLHPVEVKELFELISWVWDKNHPQNKLLRIPEYIKVKGIKYYSPQERMSNATAKEYTTADMYYNAYKEHGKMDDLHGLCAVLLREKNPNSREANKLNDIRNPLESSRGVVQRAKAISEITQVEKMMCLLFFSNVKEFVFKTFGKWLFETEEEGAEQHKGISFGWDSVWWRIAETNIFGDYESVLGTSFYTLVSYLVEKREEFNRQQQKIEFENAKKTAWTH